MGMPYSGPGAPSMSGSGGGDPQGSGGPLVVALDTRTARKKLRGQRIPLLVLGVGLCLGAMPSIVIGALMEGFGRPGASLLYVLALLMLVIKRGLSQLEISVNGLLVHVPSEAISCTPREVLRVAHEYREMEWARRR